MARKTRLDRDLERQEQQRQLHLLLQQHLLLHGDQHAAAAAPVLLIAPEPPHHHSGALPAASTVPAQPPPAAAGPAPAAPRSAADPTVAAPRRSRRLQQSSAKAAAAAAITATANDDQHAAPPGPPADAALGPFAARAHAQRPDAGETWAKVLWKEQPTPDNYVHESFLIDLVVNARLPAHRYWPVVLDALAASQQLSLALGTVLAPLHLAGGTLTATQLLAVDGAMLAAGYVLCAVLEGRRLLAGGSDAVLRVARQGGLLVGGIYLLSPLLRTLAATVSTDSVVALTVAALLVHLFLHDYTFINRPEASGRLCGRLALAAAALAAVLVASLMPSETHVFAQVLFSLELLLLSPFARRAVRAAGPAPHALLSLALAALSAWALAMLPQLRPPAHPTPPPPPPSPDANQLRSLASAVAALLPGSAALRGAAAALWRAAAKRWPALASLWASSQGGGAAWSAASQLPLAAYLLVHALVALACPWALVRITKYKTQINGPWDEAVPHMPEHLAPALTAAGQTLSAALPSS